MHLPTMQEDTLLLFVLISAYDNLIFHIYCYTGYHQPYQFIPICDLPCINSLSQSNTRLHLEYLPIEMVPTDSHDPQKIQL